MQFWPKAVAYSEDLYAIVRRDTVEIWNTGLIQNCAARFLFDVTMQDTSIRVLERDTSTQYTRCQCSFSLSVTIGGLAQGTYIATIHRSHEFPAHREMSIGLVQFTILTGGVLTSLLNGYQSVCGPVSVPPAPSLPVQFRLYQNFPNPFNPTTTIGYDVPTPSSVQLSVFNVLGERVATLVNRNEDAGKHSVEFDARNLSSGVYFYRIDAAGLARTMKMIVTQ